MWLFTRHGFFSAVAVPTNHAKQAEKSPTDGIVVRARVREHLESIKRRFDGDLGSCPIEQHAGTDYAYRLFTQRKTWSRVVSALAEEIDYSNFKSEVASHQRSRGDAYVHALHGVWEAMYTLQE